MRTTLGRIDPDRIDLTADQNDLYLYLTNSGDLYRERHRPVIANLCKFMGNGTFDHDQALTAMTHLVVEAVTRYNREVHRDEGPLKLSGHDRQAVALELLDDFYAEYRSNGFRTLHDHPIVELTMDDGTIRVAPVAETSQEADQTPEADNDTPTP
jgi:hypothetical protein